MELLITGNGQLATPKNEGMELAVLEDFYLNVSEGRIAEIGPMSEAPSCTKKLDIQGGLVIPGLVDPPTHAVFAGTREEEFLQRCSGAMSWGLACLLTFDAMYNLVLMTPIRASLHIIILTSLRLQTPELCGRASCLLSLLLPRKALC